MYDSYICFVATFILWYIIITATCVFLLTFVWLLDWFVWLHHLYGCYIWMAATFVWFLHLYDCSHRRTSEQGQRSGEETELQVLQWKLWESCFTKPLEEYWSTGSWTRRTRGAHWLHKWASDVHMFIVDHFYFFGSSFFLKLLALAGWRWENEIHCAVVTVTCWICMSQPNTSDFG